MVAGNGTSVEIGQWNFVHQPVLLYATLINGKG
jgi:hypothetical protein